MKWRTWLVGLIAIVAVSATAIHLPAEQAQPAADFTVDGVHSMVIFGIRHKGVSNTYGRFNDISGSVSWSNEKPENGSITLTIKAGSVDTNSRKRDQHLASRDFLFATKFPDIKFVSRSIRRGIIPKKDVVTSVADTILPDEFTVIGDLTLHGVTKSVSIELRKIGEATMRGTHLIGLEGRVTIKRSDFDMKHAPGSVGDEVNLIVSLEAIQN